MSAYRLKLNMDKTELIWSGTKYSITMGNASFLPQCLGIDVILPNQHVRLLGLVISADLRREKHVSNVTATHVLLSPSLVNCNTSGTHCLQSPLQHLSSRAHFHDVPRRLL